VVLGRRHQGSAKKLLGRRYYNQILLAPVRHEHIFLWMPWSLDLLEVPMELFLPLGAYDGACRAFCWPREANCNVCGASCWPLGVD
jgi:hypothetical protein